jgi:hypothetical protein
MSDRATCLRRLFAAPDVAPVTNSPTEVLSVLSGTHLSLGSSASPARLYKSAAPPYPSGGSLYLEKFPLP